MAAWTRRCIKCLNPAGCHLDLPLCPTCEELEEEVIDIEAIDSDSDEDLLMDGMSTFEKTDEEQMDMSQNGTDMDLPPSENKHLMEQSDQSSSVSVDNQDNICERIDEALVIAKDSFQCIDEALKTLKHLEENNRQVKRNICDAVVKEFEKISHALQKRKAFLIAEIKACSAVYSTEIHKTIQEIEEKRSCLEPGFKFAGGLKQFPLMGTYCDFKQLLGDLKVNLEYENFVHQYKSDIRFTFEVENIFQIIDQTGKICSSKSPKFQIGEKSDSDSLSYESLDIQKVQKKHDVKTRGQRRHCIKQELHPEYKSHQEDYNWLQKPSSPMPSDNEEKSLSSPDVIIEEIINEDYTCTPEVHKPTAITPLQSIEKIWQFKPGTDIDGQRKNKNRKPPKKKINSCSPFVQKGSSELVNLVYVVNPCHFYVRRYSQTKQAVILDKILKTLSNKDRANPTDLLVLGEIIAINSTKHELWCRGEIIALIPLENKYKGKPCGPTQYKIEDVLLLKVFLLDYGSTEVFSSVRYVGNKFSRTEDCPSQYTIFKNLCDVVRKLNLASEVQLRSVPPLAIQCAIVDIVPANPDGRWTAKCKEEFLTLVNNKCLEMKVFKEEDNKLFVDLRKPSSFKSSSNMPASIRDALVFLDLARFRLSGAAPEKSILPRSFIPPVVLEHRTNFTVAVSHINDPSDFYIQVVDNAEYIPFSRKIQTIYNSEESDDLKIKRPVFGQVCMKKYTDGSWYRALVVGFSGQEEVIIKYVDFGNTDTVHVNTLRDLKDEFLDMPCKAICCRLAFIEPCNNAHRWSPEACGFFIKVAEHKFLNCNSLGVLLDNKLSVELFESGLESISINTKMIELKYASLMPGSPGLNNQWSTKTEVWDTPAILSVNHMECQEKPLLQGKALDVRVCHVESPDRICIQWLSTENYINGLHSKMSEKYETSNPETVQWTAGMYVAVQLPVVKQWRRGLIQNIVSDRLVEVFYFDFGMKAVVDVINIRTLEDSMLKLNKMCLECSLMDIKPAGGSENWTATACDVLSYYLTGAVAKIAIEEKTKQWPLPVKIWIKDEASQEADVSDFLIKQGLALKIRRSDEPETVGKVSEKSTSITDVHELIKVTLQCDNIASETRNASEHLESDEAVSEQNLIEPYLPPRIPDSVFSAKVSCIDNGIIYVIPESLETDLENIMNDLHKSFKCFGIMGQYSWKEGEGCLIKGSDARPYRGKVLKILGGEMILVQYVDYGCIEKILLCHTSAIVFNPDVPLFCIPCQLHKTLPVGNKWQPDAIELLKELLLDRNVKVHVAEPPTVPGGVASVDIYCNSASVSRILEQYSHCVPEDSDKRSKFERSYESKHCLMKNQGNQYCANMFRKSDLDKVFDLSFENLLSPDLETPVLPRYTVPSLPAPGEHFLVKVRHIQTPNKVYISRNLTNNLLCDLDENTLCCDPDEDSLTSKIIWINKHADKLLRLTNFRSEMPCLAEYSDGKIYRAKLLSVSSYDPPKFFVDFVDYGSAKSVATESLFQLPAELIHYPVEAVKVHLAGIKPPIEDFEAERLPYCPEWSFRAVRACMDILEKDTFMALRTGSSSELSVYLYEESGNEHVYKALVEEGLVEFDE
ncbi:RING finger protein 17 isoform X2 [Xenopus laevis]|uniref:RING finger protein 17 isoform X2 n=1 Tax=Xenopus laevis TaxID=8355 RepID=A0A8J1MGJ2_XENLA|nr:RING finger protein 17 isoform X2 [Xenopus laevis]